MPQHVLRFWESKFPQVRPLKRGGGRRYYRPEDVDLLRQIRSLLYDEGYTIKGVQKLLRGRRTRLGTATSRRRARRPRPGRRPPPGGPGRAAVAGATAAAAALRGELTRSRRWWLGRATSCRDRSRGPRQQPGGQQRQQPDDPRLIARMGPESAPQMAALRISAASTSSTQARTGSPSVRGHGPSQTSSQRQATATVR